MTENDINQIKELGISKEKIFWNEPMKKYTTFKIGGLAECLIKVDNQKDLENIILLTQKNNIDLTILGNGSNVLVLDDGIKGIVLIIQFQQYRISENRDIDKCDKLYENQDIKEMQEKVLVKVGAGCKIGKLAQYFYQNNLSGFEEISGIPGSIGGAITMNSGAHGKEMKDIVKSVKCMDYSGNIKEFTNRELEFSYRNSIFKKEKYIILEAVLELEKGKKEEIKEKMNRYGLYRKEHQPIEFPSAGSTFKRGDDYITAKLIDEAGLKGYTIGGAAVSEKHAGFIINKGNATAQDVIQLTEYIKKQIKEKFNKNIELEIEIIGK